MTITFYEFCIDNVCLTQKSLCLRFLLSHMYAHQCIFQCKHATNFRAGLTITWFLLTVVTPYNISVWDNSMMVWAEITNGNGQTRVSGKHKKLHNARGKQGNWDFGMWKGYLWEESSYFNNFGFAGNMAQSCKNDLLFSLSKIGKLYRTKLFLKCVNCE